MRGSQQRQLVQRQRPVSRDGRDEGQTRDLAAIDGQERLTNVFVARRPPVGQRAGEVAHGLSTDGNQQRVVVNLSAGGRKRDLLRCVDAGQRVLAQAPAGLGDEIAEIEARHLAIAERLGHGVLAIGELRLGSQDNDPDALAEQATQNQ